MSSLDLIFDKDKPLVTDETVKQNCYCDCYICKRRKTGECKSEYPRNAMKEIAKGKHPYCGCTEFIIDENDTEALTYIIAYLEREFRSGEPNFETNCYSTAGAIWGAMNYCIKLYKEQQEINNKGDKV